MKDEVLYLEADEEITSAIDKLLELDAETVSIVVPKRSALLQSIVNLKLLKKAAQDSGKNLILVTGDRTSTHLAARIGLPVAATLGGEPSVPTAAGAAPSLTSEIVEEGTPVTVSSAAKNPLESAAADTPIVTRREIAPEPAAAKPKAAKSSKMPDFNRFQKRLLWGGAALATLLVLLLANFLFKRAIVTLYVQGEKIATDFDFTVDTGGRSDAEAAIVEGDKIEVEHELTQKFSATGKKDAGTKAKGTVTVTNYCYYASQTTLPAGTSLVATNGLKFTSTQAVPIDGAVYQLGTCNAKTASVPVEAAQNGDNYNLASGTAYTVGSAPSSGPSYLRGVGNQMSGGTSKQVTVVSQADIDSARQQALEDDKSEAEKDLERELNKSQRAIAPSFAANVGEVESSPAVGEEASQATLNLKVTYSQLAVPEKDFVAMVEAQQLKLIGEQNQIYDNGIGTAEITALPNQSNRFSFTGEAYGGSKIDLKGLAEEMKGKKYGEAADIAGKQPGVEKTDIQLRPSWATKLPRIAKNIKIELKVEDSSG